MKALFVTLALVLLVLALAFSWLGHHSRPLPWFKLIFFNTQKVCKGIFMASLADEFVVSASGNNV